MDFQEVIVIPWIFLLVSAILFFVWGMGSMIWDIFSTSSQKTNLSDVPAINHPKPDVKSASLPISAAKLAKIPGNSKNPDTRYSVMNKPSNKSILCKPRLPAIPEDTEEKKSKIMTISLAKFNDTTKITTNEKDDFLLLTLKDNGLVIFELYKSLLEQIQSLSDLLTENEELDDQTVRNKADSVPDVSEDKDLVHSHPKDQISIGGIPQEEIAESPEVPDEPTKSSLTPEDIKKNQRKSEAKLNGSSETMSPIIKPKHGFFDSIRKKVSLKLGLFKVEMKTEDIVKNLTPEKIKKNQRKLEAKLILCQRFGISPYASFGSSEVLSPILKPKPTVKDNFLSRHGFLIYQNITRMKNKMNGIPRQ